MHAADKKKWKKKSKSNQTKALFPAGNLSRCGKSAAPSHLAPYPTGRCLSPAAAFLPYRIAAACAPSCPLPRYFFHTVSPRHALHRHLTKSAWAFADGVKLLAVFHPQAPFVIPSPLHLGFLPAPPTLDLARRFPWIKRVLPTAVNGPARACTPAVGTVAGLIPNVPATVGVLNGSHRGHCCSRRGRRHHRHRCRYHRGNQLSFFHRCLRCHRRRRCCLGCQSQFLPTYGQKDIPPPPTPPPYSRPSTQLLLQPTPLYLRLEPSCPHRPLLLLLPLGLVMFSGPLTG